MAVSLRSHNDDAGDPPMSEINVTPLVDVMLVLLIIFMVAAPLMVSGIPVDLPKTQAKQLNEQKPPLAVSVDAGGKYFIGTDEAPADQFLSALTNHAENELDRRIHVRADKNLPYRAVVELMGQINSAGFSKVALVSEAPSAAVASGNPGTKDGSVPASAPPAAPAAPQAPQAAAPGR